MENEANRIKVLHDYEILDTNRDAAFDNITKLAATLFQVPVSIISMVDIDRIWFKSAYGLEIKEIKREAGLCASAIYSNDFYVIENAPEDERSRENSLVSGEFGLKFYAGIPLRVEGNYNLGTLCLIDTQPRKISDKEKELLNQLTNMVIRQLEFHLSARKAIQIEMNLSNKLQAILDNTLDAIFLVSPSHQVLSINRTMQKLLMTFFKIEVSVGFDIRDILTENVSHPYYLAFEKAMNGESYKFEHLLEEAGLRNWFLVQVSPVIDLKNQLIGVSIAVKDINERKEADKHVRQSELKFRTIVQSAANPILIVNKNMLITLVNAQVEEVFGYLPDELLYKNIDTLIPQRFQQRHIKYEKDFISKGKPTLMGKNRQTPALRKDGKEIIIEATLNTIEIENEKSVLVIISDVTSRIKTESRIKKQFEKLKFIAWQHSHELRKPLANILGVIYLIKQDDIKNYNTTYLRYLEQSAKELDDIIHKIVSASYESENDNTTE